MCRDQLVELILLALARRFANRTVRARCSAVERHDQNVFGKRRQIAAIARAVRRYRHAVFEFRKGDGRHHHVANETLRKALRNLFRLVFHQVDADIGVEHVARHYKSSRSACSWSPRPSAMKPGPNLANFLSTPVSGRRVGRIRNSSPTRSISTSTSARSKANSAGMRTACELPLRKTFVSTLNSCYGCTLYVRTNTIVLRAANVNTCVYIGGAECGRGLNRSRIIH